MLERIDSLSGLIQLVLIVVGIIVIYFKDKGIHDVSNANQDRDIVKLKEDCEKCKKEVDSKFIDVGFRLEKMETKQSAEIKTLYDRLDNVEQRILNKIDNRIDGTLNAITELFKNQK